LPIDVVVIGGVTLDENVVGGVAWRGVGGGAAYASYVLAALGARVGLVTRVSRDVGEVLLRALASVADMVDMNGLVVGDVEVPVFRNVYSGEERRQEAVRGSYVLGPKDLPPGYLSARLFLVTPVLGEVSPVLLESLLQRGASVAVDIQGFVRELRPDGSVAMASSLRIPLAGLMLLKAGVDELPAVSPRGVSPLLSTGIEFVAVTLGRRGSIVYVGREGRAHSFSPPRVRTVDATGAGDVYVAVLAYELARGRDVVEAGRLATAAAAYSTQFRGPSYPISPEDIRRLAEQVGHSELGLDEAQARISAGKPRCT